MKLVDFDLKVPKGKGGKASKVAISASLAAQLRAFAYDNSMSRTDRFWPITKPRAFQIVAKAFDRAGIPKPSRDRDKVGTVHILWHSGAIERLLRLTGNPKAVQDQLRHSTALMTLRYMKTLTHDESLKVQEGVNYQW
jgi:integrase